MNPYQSIGHGCSGRAFNRRRRRRRLRMHDVAKSLDIGNDAVSQYERGRYYGISSGAMTKLDELTKVWTLEDYENGTHGTDPNWPEPNKWFARRE